MYLIIKYKKNHTFDIWIVIGLYFDVLNFISKKDCDVNLYKVSIELMLQ